MSGVYIGHKNIRRITKSGGQIKIMMQAAGKSKRILKQIDWHREWSCKLQIIVADV